MVLPTTEIIELFKWTVAMGSVAQYALLKSVGAAVKGIRKSSISSADDVSLKTNLDNDVVGVSNSKSSNLTMKTSSDLTVPKVQNRPDLPASAKSHVDVSTSGVADAELTKVKHTADLNLSTKSSVNVPTSKTADIDLPTVKSYTDMNLSSKTVSNAATAAAVGGVKPGDVDVPKVKDIYKSGETSVPKDLDVPSGTTSRKAHVEDVEHYTTWAQMKAEHYRTVTEFVQANKPEGASHPREWLSKPNHEFKIEHMSDGTQVWRYTNDIGVEKVYVDGVLQGGGVPNPKVTQHFEQLNSRIKDFDPEVASTLQKSNAGEILADGNMRIVRENVGANGNTYTLESIGRPAPSGIDDPIVKGIDGIYKNQTPPPSYVINETKWGSSQINQHTLDGPQMSERWIRNRLDKLSMMEQVKINKAIKTGDVEFVISKVDTSGKVSTYYATSVTDSTGQVTQVKEGAIWP